MIAFLALLLLGVPDGLTQSGVAPSARDNATVVAFVNVAVVTMEDEAVLQEHTVLVQGERILSVGPVDTVSVPAGATVVDGSGRYLIPGLADMHMHAWVPFGNGPVFLAAGITTVLNLGTQSADYASILPERDRSRTAGFVGPTLYTVGPLISGTIHTPARVERLVRENVEGGYDLIKVGGMVTPEAFARLHETASRLGIKVTGHAQRNRGMQPVYAYEQDLAHVEEYLYAAFNPATPGLTRATNLTVLVLVLLLVTHLSWGVGAMWRRLRTRTSSALSPLSRSLRRRVGILTAVGWSFFIALNLSATPPFAGVLAGKTVAIGVVGVLMLSLVVVAIVLTLNLRRVWREGAGTSWTRASFLLLVGLAWILVACSGYMTPRSWRTTEGQLARYARETAAAGIWVTPTLVAWDYNRRQAGDEFSALMQRPGMRHLTPAVRDRWINRNPYRVPAFVEPITVAARQRYAELLSQLVRKLHDANVPLLAGSDVGMVGILPGSSLHEELSLLVQAGLTPYEALRTATVNPAVYLDAAEEFGRIVPGLRADLVLLAGNPVDDISHTRSRVGVMKRGRWFPADELEAALAQLAESRK